MPKKSILEANYLIVIVKVKSVDDGLGLAKDQDEAVKLFDLVMEKVTDFERAELYFNKQLIKEQSGKGKKVGTYPRIPNRSDKGVS